MKIGIITLFEENYNYGAVLQAFALESYCKSLGHECDVIRYKHVPESAKKNMWTRICRKCRTISSPGEFVWEVCNLFVKKQLKALEKESEIGRQEKFREFIQERVTCSAKTYTGDSVSQVNDLYEAFICGSDQIWKPECYTDTYFLKFATPEKRRVAYAPSIAVERLSPEEMCYMRPLIENLDAVSVREEQGAELLKAVTGNLYPIVVDPVLLMPKEFWAKIKSKEIVVKEPFYFCYFLSPNYEAMKKIHKIAVKQRKKVVCISSVAGSHLYLNKFTDIFVDSAGPAEFIRLISDAEMIYTDSFHGTVFSLIFEKPFWVFDRIVGDKSASMNSRIDTLLKMYGAEKRKVGCKDALCNCIQEKVNEVYDQRNAKKRIDLSRSYIESALRTDMVHGGNNAG